MLEADLGKAVNGDALAEQQAVRRAAEVEHAELRALVDALAGAHGDLARAHLVHADGHEGHEADGRVVGLDEEDGARGEGREVGLRLAEAVGLDVVRRRRGRCRRGGGGGGGGRGRGGEERLAEVRPLDHGRAHHAPRHGGVPAVVGERGQKGLVDGAVAEVRG